jgi:hypothetical protein
MNTALEALLHTIADDDHVSIETGGPCITAWTRQCFANAGEATSAAHDLLAEVLHLGYRLHGGIVGAERCEVDGTTQWRGELIEVLLLEVA